MNQEQYWRNLIAKEISNEHDRVKAYYYKKGLNNGGISQEEYVRLNIFKLCESIVSTMKNSPLPPTSVKNDTPPPPVDFGYVEKPEPDPVPPMEQPVAQPRYEGFGIHRAKAETNIIKDTIEPVQIDGQVTIEEAIQDSTQGKRQNEFGEFI